MMEPQATNLTPLVSDDFASTHGIAAAFVELAVDAGAPAEDGKISLFALNEWLIGNFRQFRKRAQLPEEVLPDTPLNAGEPTQSHISKVIRVHRDYFNANAGKLQRFSWARWRSSALGSFAAYLNLEDENWLPDEILDRWKPFTTLLEDAAWCAVKAIEVSNLPNPEGRQDIYSDISRYSHFCVLSTALALEAAANCTIDALAPRGKTSSEIEQLPTMGKFDVYLLSRGRGVVLDRGNPIVQAAEDLIPIRNNHVHPKVSTRRELRTLGAGYNYETKRSKILDIPHGREFLELKPQHAEAAMKALMEFLNYYLLGLCEHTLEESIQLLFHMGEVPNAQNRYYWYSGSNALLRLIEEWELDARFLHLRKRQETVKDGVAFVRYETYNGPNSAHWTEWVRVP